MDLTGIDESVGEMFCVVACALYIFGTFASFTFGADLVALASLRWLFIFLLFGNGWIDYEING